MRQRFQHTCVLVLLALTLVLAACGGAAENDPAAPAPDNEVQESQQVTLAIAFVPNIQFAPFYVAESKGYYTDEGIDITIEYNMETDVTQRVASWPDSNVQFALASGLSVMLARQQGLPVKTVMTQYQQFPVVFFGKGDITLDAPEDLAGQRIGIPGRFGASYYALLALLYASDIAESELDVEEVGFNQFQLVLEDRIDVATGYAMNEPVKLRQEGAEVSVLRVADYFPLASDGIITNEAMIESDPELVRAFIRASLRGLQDTLDNPDEAFELSQSYIEEAALIDAEFERAVLEESLSYWQSDPLGYTDPSTWEQSHTFLLDADLLTEPIEVAAAYTNEFLPTAEE